MASMLALGSKEANCATPSLTSLATMDGMMPMVMSVTCDVMVCVPSRFLTSLEKDWFTPKPPEASANQAPASICACRLDATVERLWLAVVSVVFNTCTMPTKLEPKVVPEMMLKVSAELVSSWPASFIIAARSVGSRAELGNRWLKTLMPLSTLRMRGARSWAFLCVHEIDSTRVPARLCRLTCSLTCFAAAVLIWVDALMPIQLIEAATYPETVLAKAELSCMFWSKEKYCTSMSSESEARGIDLICVRT